MPKTKNHIRTQGEILQAAFKRYKKNRPNITKSAFAQFLKIPGPRLHDFMNDKRILTLAMAEYFSDRLGLPPDEKNLLLELVRDLRRRRKPRGNVIQIKIEDFRQISSWYYFAILALVDTVDFISNPSWVAKRLSLSLDEAKEALLKLTDLGFLSVVEGQYKLNHFEVETESDIPQAEVRQSQKQSLKRVIDLMDNIPPLEREIDSITFAGDPQKLLMAKKMIRQFSQKLVSRMESGKRGEVYELNIQLIPISQKLP